MKKSQKVKASKRDYGKRETSGKPATVTKSWKKQKLPKAHWKKETYPKMQIREEYKKQWASYQE